MQQEADVPGAVVTDKASLREIVGEPIPTAVDKVNTRLDKYCRQFIEMSPFLCIGTVAASGHIDMSPRGDPPGSIKYIDDTTLLIPERQGNQRADSMQNLLDNPRIGLIFFLPGVEETLRVGGTVTITRNPELLGPLTLNGKTPKLGLLVNVDFAMFQCAKALVRSKLWDPNTRIDRSEFPKYGQIVRDQRRPDSTVEELEAFIQDNYRTQLY